MFEQHPVPQQISAYSFKLVGNMTLKQFFQLAGGAVIALILYAMPLAPYLKWPGILFSVVSGAAFAFLPIQDRPLEQWLFAFFRSIYSPTVFVWQSNASNFPYFKDQLDSQAQQASFAGLQAQPISPVPKEESPAPEYVQKLEQSEADKLNAISSLMSSQTHQEPDNSMPQGEMVGQYVGQVTKDSSQNTVQPKVEEHKEMQIPQAGVVTIDSHQGYQQSEPVSQPQQITTGQVNQVFNTNQQTQGTQAQFTSEASPPLVPEQPNLLVGQVLDKDQKIVEGAILEVNDNLGRPVRALKTNRAGHFMVVTPLPDGDYVIQTEKEGHNFEPVSVKLENKIVEPIMITAK